jgi:hypothetical protein
VTDRDLEALEEGDPLAALKADRNLLAAAMYNAEPKELPALSREYRAVLAELERRGAGQEESTSNDIAAQRAKRRAAGLKKAAGT